MLATKGFPTSLDRRFSVSGVFLSHATDRRTNGQTPGSCIPAICLLDAAGGKNIAGVGLCTLVSVGFFLLTCVYLY